MKQLMRLVSILALAIGCIGIMALLPPGASAAECTDSWIGPAEGTWQTAANWSTGKVPTETDVACIGSGKTAKITEGANKVGVVQGEGALTISTFSLELTRPPGEGVSSIASLTIAGGTLKGVGEIDIASTLTWAGGTMEGTGSTVLSTGASGSINSGVFLGQRTLLNKGTLTLATSYMYMVNSAKLENVGTFNANTQGTGSGILRSEAGSLIVNTGTFRKTSGSGETRNQVKFENQGTINAETGTLGFTYPEPVTLNSGSVLKGSISFNGPSVTSQSFTATNGTINVDAVSSLSIEGGYTAEVNNFTLTGVLKGAGELDISGTLSWSAGTMEGSGSTALLSSGSGSLSNVFLRERTLVNKGTLTLPTSYLYMYHGAMLTNAGTFNANTEGKSTGITNGVEAAPHIVNTGTFQKVSGTGTTEIGPSFENLGVIHEASGQLKFLNPASVASSNQFGSHSKCGDPVDCATGSYSEAQTDFAIGGRGVGLDLIRTYNAKAAATVGAFGYGWTSSFSDHLVSEESGKTITLTQADGGIVPFTESGKGSYAPAGWSQDTLSGSSESGYTLTTPDQTKYAFSGAGKLESVTDRNGNATTLAYNKSGQLETITDPASRKITLTYNGEGLVEKAQDPMGNTVKYTYESKNLKTVTLPGEASANWQFKYDASHRMTSMTDGRGGKTTNEYDSSSRVISQTDPAERKLTFEYASFRTKITNKATGAVTDEWFTSNNEPFSITRGFGTANATTETFTYNAAGQLLSKTDGNGHKTTYTYDEHGNRTSETDAAEDETKWTYNGTHDVMSETTPNGEKTTIARESHGNPETISRPAPGEKTQTTSYEYGTHGELESVTDPLERTWAFEYNSQGDQKAEIDPEGDKRTWGYNEDSQLTSMVSPRGNEEGAEPAKFTTSIERDAQGRPIKVTDPLEGTTKYAYDADGNLESETDPNNHKTKFTYNADNERTKVEKPNGNVIETGYDGAGQVTSQIDGNKRKTTYVRNILEQPNEIIDPLERKTTEEYDAAGNLKSKTDPAKRKTSYVYDAVDRLKEVSYSDGVTPTAKFGYDKDSNLTDMTDGTGESTYEYDQLDRLTQSKDGHGDTAGYEYNLGNEQTGITYPNGKSVTRTFDKAGRLESVTDWLAHTTIFAYNRDSNVRSTTFPEGTTNVDEYGYDRADRMSEVKMKKGAETLASLGYTRDKVGQIEKLTSKGLPGAEEESFSYDENNRLTKAGAGSYEYDAANNPTKIPGSTNTYDKASELEKGTGTTYAYDEDGERTKLTPSEGPATTYKYDQAGNLTAVERSKEGETPAISENYTSDGTGLRASQTVSATTHYLTWDLSASLPLILNDGQNSYIYGPGNVPVEQISSEETPTYYHHDQLGSTRMLTSSTGEVTATFTYGAYGALAASTGSQTTPLGYAGQYTDTQSGLQYLRSRYYDPATGQFVTQDPLAALTRAPYFYGSDNPLNSVDPTGMSCLTTAGGLGISIPALNPVDCAGEALNDVASAATSAPGFVLTHRETVVPVAAGAVCGLQPELCPAALAFAAGFATGSNIYRATSEPCFNFVNAELKSLLVTAAALAPSGILDAAISQIGARNVGLTPSIERVLHIILDAPGTTLEAIHAGQH